MGREAGSFPTLTREAKEKGEARLARRSVGSPVVDTAGNCRQRWPTNRTRVSRKKQFLKPPDWASLSFQTILPLSPPSQDLVSLA